LKFGVMRSQLSKLQLVWAVLLLAAGVAGCGGAYGATAHGIVTLDGNIVPRCTVAFHPVARGPAAYARIEKNGGYVVRTGREEGLPPGEYFVTVAANEPPTEAQTAQGGLPPPGKPITPAWYASKDSSGLKVVVESGDNELDLELKSTPPPGWNPRGRSG
jgi:hypothetical protein